MDAVGVGAITILSGLILWALKTIGEKLIKSYFEKSEMLEDAKASMLNEKMNHIRIDMEKLSMALKSGNDESIRTKLMMQSLNHQIDSFRAELKASDKVSKTTSEYLIKILRSMQDQINKQGAEIDSFGKILMRQPEGK